MAETIEELERRRDLLKEIAALANEMPSDDEIKAAADHLETLRAIGQADPA